MAARKLQTEIDRTLKKVAEGVELFESIYDKMQASTNQTQKEKQEMDLKTQIKKLQRMRDQIKTWVASNDIKDKSALLDNRKLIETQMEKFKACEKEMKTKAFSKEGLTQATKLDPREQEKEDATIWLQTKVEELQMQVESAEAEIESLQQGATKKRGKGGSSAAGRLEELEHFNERRKWHIGRLEIILRLLNNGSLGAEQVQELQEDVAYFVERNADEDYDEDEGIYDALNLDEEEEKFGVVGDDNDSEDSEDASEDFQPRTPKKHDEESVTSSKRDDSPILKKSTVTSSLRKGSIDSKPPPNLNFAQQPMSSILKASLQNQQPPIAPRPPAQLPPIRYAAAAAAAVAPPPPLNPATPSTNAAAVPPVATPSVPTSQEPSLPVQSSPSLTHPSVASPMLSSSASVSQQPEAASPVISEVVAPSSHGIAVSPQRPSTLSQPQKGVAIQNSDLKGQSLTDAESPFVPGPTESPTSDLNSLPPHVNGGLQAAPQQASISPLPQQLQANTNAPAVNAPVPPGVKVPPNETVGSFNMANAGFPTQRPPSTVQPIQARPIGSNTISGLSDLVTSFENVKQKANTRMNIDQVHKMLDGGAASIPQPRDTEKPKYYVPRNPYQTPPYYPQTTHALLNTAGIFSQLDVETLFYVFYFLPGTYQQYLAAKELKRQSWRFHVKYFTWFQRHSEPQAITEEYEQGVYVYFDWEGSWCQRKKSDFRFEYRYLSED